MKTETFTFTDTAARDTRVKGSERLLVVTHGSVVTRLEVKGHAIDGRGLFAVSDVTVPTVSYEELKHLLMAGVDKA